jgi:hypothetical protein
VNEIGVYIKIASRDGRPFEHLNNLVVSLQQSYYDCCFHAGLKPGAFDEHCRILFVLYQHLCTENTILI